MSKKSFAFASMILEYVKLGASLALLRSLETMIASVYIIID
jgi:hypothetical protein